MDDREARLRRPSDYGVKRAIPLRWADVDTYGHVNNAVMYLLMDTAVNGWLMEATQKDIRKDLPVFAVVARTDCRYFREMRFGDPPEVGIRVTHMGRSSVHYELGIFIDDGEPAAIGTFIHVYVAHEDRRPRAIPFEVRRILEELANAQRATKEDS